MKFSWSGCAKKPKVSGNNRHTSEALTQHPPVGENVETTCDYRFDALQEAFCDDNYHLDVDGLELIPDDDISACLVILIINLKVLKTWH